VVNVSVTHRGGRTEVEALPHLTLGSPDETRGGPNVEAAIANAEEGIVVEGVHTLPGDDENHDSRVEQMPDVDGVTEGRVDGRPGTE
jgi:hypothetical protein